MKSLYQSNKNYGGFALAKNLFNLVSKSLFKAEKNMLL